ncbi:hypothetical protein FPRO05_14268 [Fusarium proliferatum]|uniref:Uncharacterized protein n=1 Tax=Gibberella intermedia TaxID=948311 RepID=A0A365MT81_GIBIN|nr:hypothetical protein FPRO05_14268 [Fusarium proliferatum]
MTVASERQLADQHDRLKNLVLWYNDAPDSDNVASAIAIRKFYGWDQATCMAQASAGDPIQIHLDLESLKTLKSPVNLRLHRQDELFSRNEKEIKEFEDAMSIPNPAHRTQHIQEWYRACTSRAERRPENQDNAVYALDIDWLCDRIKKAKEVRLFGGASLDFLRRLILKGVAHKIRCHLQVGTYNLSSNLFPYQFNIALNPDAAEYVFGHYEDFEEFTVVASRTAQSVKYRLLGLDPNFSLLGKRIMGYNMGKTPLEIAKGEATLDSESFQHKLGMPDLTMIIIHLRPDLIKCRIKFVGISDRSDGMIYKRKRSGIKSYEMKEKSSLDMDLPDIFAVLAAERRTRVAFARFERYCSGLLGRFI